MTHEEVIIQLDIMREDFPDDLTEDREALAHAISILSRLAELKRKRESESKLALPGGKKEQMLSIMGAIIDHLEGRE
jgi:hypothetical protein